MRKAILIAALLLGGCGHTGDWDMSEPFSMDVDRSLAWTVGSTIPPIFEQAVVAMGGQVALGAAQVVHFHLDGNCDSTEAGYVISTDTAGIYLCHQVLDDPVLLRFVVLHEFGHRLGQTAHRPCESRGLMAPSPACSRDIHGLIAQAYQPGDRPWVCGAGDVVNAQCSP